MGDEIDAFITKTGASPESRNALTGFVEFLKERGQFISNGDLKTQFIEKSTVFDKKKVPIEVERCLVCGHEEYDVKKDA